MDKHEEKLRILQIVFCWGSGGVERLITNYVQNIPEVVIDVLVLQACDTQSIFNDVIRNAGGEIYNIKQSHKSLIRLFDRMREIKEFCDNHKYDIVHVNGGTCIDICYAIAAQKSKYKPKVIMQAHADNVEPPKVVIKKASHFLFKFITKNKPDGFLACSKKSFEWMFGKYNEDKNKMVLLNGIELDRYQFNEEVRNQIRKEYNLEDKFVLGTVGRIVPQKNPYFILDIIATVSAQRKDIVLLWAGEGPMFEEVKKKAVDMGISKLIIFLGARKRIWNYYQAMDLFILPSVYEGLGIVNIEAQCTGLKCLVSDVVPEEAAVTDLIEYLPLNNKNVWVDRILQGKAVNARKSHVQDAYNYGYSQKESAKRLYQFCNNLIS